MATTQRGEKLELELLPEELYGNIRGPLHPRNDALQPNPATHGGIFEQLYHRNVLHIGALYVLLCWVVVEIAPPVFKQLHFPSWFGVAAACLAVLGFPLITLFAWNKALTPLGWKAVDQVPADESLAEHVRNRLNRALALVLAVGLVYLAIARFLLPPGETDAPGLAGAVPAAALAAPVAAPAAAPPMAATSVAVLAFTDGGDAKDLGYLVNGLTEELLPVLASVPQLAVTSGDSSFRFHSTDADTAAAGAALGVQYLVAGSVLRVGDQMQVVVRLVDAHDGAVRWTKTFDRDIDSAFELRDDIAGGVVNALGVPVGADGVHGRRLVRNANARELYLRGRQAYARGDRAGYEQAADLYKQALDLEPQSATIEASVAELDLAMVQKGLLAPQTGVEQARQAAQRAESFDTNVAKAHRLMAAIHSQYDWDWHGAAHELDAARSLEPQDPKILADLGNLDLANGQFDGAARNLQAAIGLDPLNAGLLLELGRAQLWDGRLAQAEISLRHALRLEPNLKSAHFLLGKVLLAGGDQQGALAEVKSESDARRRLAGMAEVLYAAGRKPESDAALAQLKPLASTQWGSGLAGVYAARNEPDAAFQWLDQAYAQKDADLRLVRGNPSFQGVSGDPRFVELQRKMDLPG
jgi:TolB-like protein/Tfp pilus assembly protein PilF